jgi:hypothetical protein
MIIFKHYIATRSTGACISVTDATIHRQLMCQDMPIPAEGFSAAPAGVESQSAALMVKTTAGQRISAAERNLNWQ